jgi:hypothetical protein
VLSPKPSSIRHHRRKLNYPHIFPIMKAILVFLVLIESAIGGRFERAGIPGCAVDNCARAVTGSSGGTATVAHHKVDCTSFMQVITYTIAVRVFDGLIILPLHVR